MHTRTPGKPVDEYLQTEISGTVIFDTIYRSSNQSHRDRRAFQLMAP